jgi:DnaJ-class molecular chaperone
MYSICSARKREIYDQVGEEGLKQGVGGAGSGAQFYSNIDPHELFSQFFGGGGGGGSSPFGGMGGLFSSATGPGSTRMFFTGSSGGPAGTTMFTDGSAENHEPMDFSSSDIFSKFGGFGAGHDGSSFRHHGSRQDPPIECHVDLTLEEMFHGCTKKMKITRRVLSPEGMTSNEDKILTIDVKPGWKAGTKVTFSREGDQSMGRIPSDIVFVIGEKRHRHFVRSGHNLKYKARISLKQALCGGQIQVPKIDGGHITLPLSEIISPDTVEVISGEGMTISKQPGTRGDLQVNFDIDFPRSLPPNSVKSLKNLLPD